MNFKTGIITSFFLASSIASAQPLKIVCTSEKSGPYPTAVLITAAVPENHPDYKGQFVMGGIPNSRVASIRTLVSEGKPVGYIVTEKSGIGYSAQAGRVFAIYRGSCDGTTPNGELRQGVREGTKLLLSKQSIPCVCGAISPKESAPSEE